jgi:GMP synthase (glutamine-hydrolysing)
LSRPIVILRTGDAPAEVRASRGDFPAWIRDAAGDAWEGEWTTVDLRTDEPLPALDAAAAWVVTGSASSVTERARWMLRAEAHLRAGVAAGLPVLGICFGHQLLAQALDGLVARSPRGRELGTVSLDRTDAAADDALFRSLPPSFRVNASHVDAVVRAPEGARVLATTELEPVAAFAVGACAWGVQFHPEFDGDIVRGYVRVRAQLMRAEGLAPERALAGAEDTPHGREVLRHFVRLGEVRRRTMG